ncbi:MAG: glutamine amidotransferase [Candidatus Omnitrophica bacterium]|nr:glutamine amidotransferase [Candidatus Omnitrophota bacterium]
MRNFHLIITGILFCLISTTIVWAKVPPVTITSIPVTGYIPENNPSIQYTQHNFRIKNSAGTNYTIREDVTKHKQPDGTWKFVGSAIGMPEPSYANWYGDGFFQILINNRDIQNDIRPIVKITESGSDGILDFIWNDPLALVRVRFISDPGQKYLLMELRWEAHTDIKTVQIIFYCYPQGFSVGEPERLEGLKLNRVVDTPVRKIPQIKIVNIDPKTEYWLFYHDTTLEKTHAGNSFTGPCALMILPKDISHIQLNVGDYTVITTVNCKVKKGRARFALWDFAGNSVVQAKKLLQTTAPQVLKMMSKKRTWLPDAIKNFDVRTERIRIRKLALEIGPSIYHANTEVTALEKQLNKLAVQQRVLLITHSAGIQSENDFITALTRYHILYWQAERPVGKNIRVLVLAGPFSSAWNLGNIISAEWGKNSVKWGYYFYEPWIGSKVSYFPSTVDELLGYNVIVLADIPQDAFSPEQRQSLTKYVKLGGGLLMLGGIYTYGTGSWNGSPLKPLLPVTIGKPFDLSRMPNDSRVRLTTVGSARLDMPMTQNSLLGVVSWRNNVAAKPGAQEWMSAKGRPFAVFSRAEKGRVIAILGTTLGEPAHGQTSFYDSRGWPELVRKILMFLAHGH